MTRASVVIKEERIAAISKGLLVLFGVEKNDDEEKVIFLAEKTLNLRVFPDGEGKMNLSCMDICGEILVVSQFTLAGDCSKGRRPGFDNAAPPDLAQLLYQKYAKKCPKGLRRTLDGSQDCPKILSGSYQNPNRILSGPY